MLFTQVLNTKDIKCIRDTFYYIDDDNSGVIELNELVKAFKDLNMLSNEEAEKSESSEEDNPATIPVPMTEVKFAKERSCGSAIDNSFK